MPINYPDAVAAAKSVTELAIQYKLIDVYTSTEDTAKEVAKFYRTVYEELFTGSKE